MLQEKKKKKGVIFTQPYKDQVPIRLMIGRKLRRHMKNKEKPQESNQTIVSALPER